MSFNQFNYSQWPAIDLRTPAENTGGGKATDLLSGLFDTNQQCLRAVDNDDTNMFQKSLIDKYQHS